MAIFKPKLKETTEDRLQKAINLGREEVLKEVLEWLDEIIDDADDGCGSLMVYFTSFESKEEMLQSFKERFNIE